MSESVRDLIGSSRVIACLREEVAAAAKSSAKVVITGESGVGKELAARAVHDASTRRSQPLRAVNCAAVPDTLLESELFGHLRGSFTGAVRDHQGVFESAHGGTAVLDEIGDASPRMQGLLLRFLQFGELQRVGDSGSRHVDVRIVATTRRDLRELITEGEFRLDLYYRLHVIAIRVPPLRERADDIPTLLEHFMRRFSIQHRLTPPPIGAETMAWLKSYSWPGNVRELRNLAERFVIRRETGGVDPAWLDSTLERRREQASALAYSPDAATIHHRAVGRPQAAGASSR
jgi:DNA-binding NtrC family response regulator